MKKTILEELEQYIPVQKEKILEVRGINAISAAINYIELLEKNYSKEVCEDLKKKFLLAVVKKEPKKFVNKIRNINEDK